MPAKKGYKKTYKKTYKKKAYKKRVRNTIVSTIRTTHHMPIAQRLNVCFEQAANGYWASGSASGQFIFGGNYLVQHNAGNQGPIYDSALAPPNADHGGVNSFPMGLNTYLDTIGSDGHSLYNRLTCYASRVTITVSPQAVADISSFGISPVEGSAVAQAYPVFGQLYGADPAYMGMSPYGKELMVTSNNNIRQNTIVLYLDHAKYFGISRKQYFTEDNYSHMRTDLGDDGNVHLNPPNKSIGYEVAYKSQDGANLTNNIVYQIKVKYYCILSQPANTSLAIGV